MAEVYEAHPFLTSFRVARRTFRAFSGKTPSAPRLRPVNAEQEEVRRHGGECGEGYETDRAGVRPLGVDGMMDEVVRKPTSKPLLRVPVPPRAPR